MGCIRAIRLTKRRIDMQKKLIVVMGINNAGKTFY